MKKGKREIKFSNRWLYTFIALGILMVVGVGVYAATYTASGAGHPYTELSACADGQILKMNGANWACGTDADTNTDFCSGGACGSSLTVSGSVTATEFIYSSDKALKTNIQPLEDSLDKILQMQGVSFKFKSSGENSIGLIAQDIEKISPELVSGKEGNKGVAYGNIVALLIESVKEQQKQIEDLKNQINELKLNLNS